MLLVKLGLDHGERLIGKLNPDKMVTFRKTNSAHPVFKLSGKSSRFFFFRKVRLYIVLKNLAEAHHLYHKHSLHL